MPANATSAPWTRVQQPDVIHAIRQLLYHHVCIMVCTLCAFVTHA